MAKINPGLFLRQVRQEVAKVTWPSRKETTISTGMVFLMVVLASVFFLLVDQFFAWAVKLIFGLGA
ncbi:preprotein translocase subunit SecE [Telmatospirillum sp.]|uniref:preprotein translocase subunit SecE n=1 Tax=Telmatospirillum sp. TaxID=2079197 RepID=UPI00132517C3|nr:preprotein translocase subunit SecE [Telmatospirillum sp.]MDR3437519.1 preprotein translocase subunit SecE [Telmatospirillum sp.]MTJ81650.1 preprotein translocase subunit SecE [Telmatospirillum sp.]